MAEWAARRAAMLGASWVVRSSVAKCTCVRARTGRASWSLMAAAAPKVARSEAEAALRATFGVGGFRPGQWEAVQAALAGRDSCVFLPTGAG
eukprot:1886085-Prymnesium_polylepis.1